MALRHRDIILAGTVAFIAWGFVTHWIPTTRYLPYAFSTGVLATTVLFGWLILTTSRGSDSQEREWDYGPRNVAFVKPKVWEAETKALNTRSEYLREPLYPPSFVISDNVDGLIDLVLRDFVRSWYDRISSQPAFTIEVDKAVREALATILQRLLDVDLVEICTSRLVPIITNHLKDFNDAERAVKGKRLTRNVTESDELDLAIAGKYRDGKLHAAASLAYSDTKIPQQQHLRSVVTRLLPKILPKSMTTSPAVTVLIKEIVSCAVLFPIIQLLSDPDTWNQLMENYGRTILHDRKTVRKVRAALDEKTQQAPASSKSANFPKLAPHDNERKFERFIRAIKQCNTLSDARRFRSEVASQLRKDSAVENPDPVYIRRLEAGKRILDQKVAVLSTTGSGKPKLSLQPPAHPTAASRLESSALRDVLYNASGLSYFMEFMDRQGLMRLVQFWIVVDGFRNPLEDDHDDEDEEDDGLPQWTDSERADIAQMKEAYLSKPELKISPDARQNVSQFLKAGSKATPLQYRQARRAILQAQTAVYQDMQDPYFQKFKKSDLWYKLLATEEATAPAQVSPAVSHASSTDLETSVSSLPMPKTSRTSSAKHGLQAPDLRRAIASSSDLKAFVKSGQEGQTRRSLDGTPSRAPLFDDDYDSEPLARSTQSVESGDVDGPRVADDPSVVDAMQAALNDILEDGPDKESLFSDSATRSPQEIDSMHSLFDVTRSGSPLSMDKKARPSIASLGLVGAPSRRGVFTEDDLFGEEEKFLEDEIEDSSEVQKTQEDQIHEAAPGDLGLTEAIDALTQDIDRLVTQESILDSLTKKAELTNNVAELRILKKSKASLQREIHRKELQKQQYIVQESDNSLYGRATLSINPSILVGQEADGREYAMYVIEVRRKGGDGLPAAFWAITRRYSEFHELNKQLRANYAQVRSLEFPRRQTLLKLQKDFLQKRRVALEKYLRELLLIPAICRSREFRAFLSQSAISSSKANASGEAETRDFVTRIYNSVTDGMEEFLGNIPVLDQLSVAGQNLISAATSQLASTNGSHLSSTSTDPNNMLAEDVLAATEAEAELRAFESRELEPFVKPICDLFLELFSLNNSTNWLRGRAVVVVLHQLLGGTIERKVRENFRNLSDEDNVVKYLNMIRDIMWPGGKPKPPGKERTTQEKGRTRKEAALLLATLMPDIAGGVVGRANAQQASRKIAATFNNRRLNTHLVFALLDEIVQTIFGEQIVR